MGAFVIPTTFSAIDKFSAPVLVMSKRLDAFAGRANKAMNEVGGMFKRPKIAADSWFDSLSGGHAGIAIAGGLGLAGLAVKEFISEASKIESTTAYFTPVLGSVQKAQKLVQMLNVEASKTPFEFEHIAGVATTILPLMNGDLDKTIKTFRMLGDTAGGSVDKLQRVTLGYSKALLKGKITLESLNIIAEAGVPIFGQMAKQMYGNEKATAKLFDNISKGNVPLEILTKTFEAMTSKGGLFFRGMIISSETADGIFSSLRDSLKMTAAELGSGMLPIVKEYALKATDLAEKAKQWAIANKELISEKVNTFIQKLANTALFLYENIDLIVFGVKAYIGTLVVLKAISIATAIYTYGMATATVVYNASIGIAAIRTGVMTTAVSASAVATATYTAGLWLANAASIALAAVGPWGIIALAIAAVLIPFDKLLGDFKTLEEYQNKALKENKVKGFQDEKNAIIQTANAYEKYGKSKEDAQKMALIDAEKILKADRASLYYKQANAKTDSEREIADRALSTIQGRESALQQADNVFQENDRQVEAVNVEKEKQNAMQRTFSETIVNNKATLEINNNTDKKAELKGNGNFGGIKLTSTLGF